MTTIAESIDEILFKIEPIVKPKIKYYFSNIKYYFYEKDSPFNIAIFRIIFFLFILTSVDKERIYWFSQLPPALKFPPVGMKCLLSIVPITPDLAHKMMVLFMGFSFLGMVGCFARTSSFFAAMTGTYVLGIPQFYGQVIHYDHLIWFMLILSSSRCADVLSVDSIIKAVREADRGLSPKKQDSTVYALPLRFIWLLMGIIYFFPGFWKLVRPHWVWSDTLKYYMYGHWYIDELLPSFRLDHYPLLFKIYTLAVVSFELSFVFLIFVPVLRQIAAITGVLFHSMVRIFMQINFFHLQFCYVSFINWAGLFAKIGKGMFKEPFHVCYDGKTRSYRRMIAVLIKFDILQRVVFSGQIRPQENFFIDRGILKFTGIALLLINSYFGFNKIEGGWPFSCYPTFSRNLKTATIISVTPYGVMKNKEEQIDLTVLKRHMRDDRYFNMMLSILETSKSRQLEKLNALVSLMKTEGIDLRKYSKVRFYETTYSTLPEKAYDPPISRELVAEIAG